MTANNGNLVDLETCDCEGERILVTTLTKKEDAVDHPSHYTFGPIETIDFIEAKELGFHLGNVVKYVSRAEHKGKPLEDLKKAQWYLNRYIEKVENEI